MQTEQATREPRRGGQPVARALQELAPLACELVDRHGRRVPLTSAGHLLRAGRKYRLRVVGPNDPDLTSVEVPAPPSFLAVGPAVATTDGDGNKVHEFPVRAHKDLKTALLKAGSTECDDLDVAFHFRRDSGKHDLTLTCPVLVQPGLLLVFFAVLAVAAGLFVPVVVRDLFGATSAASLGEKLVQWLGDFRLWIFLALVAAWSLGCCAWSLYQRHRRTRELREAFERRYPPLPARPAAG